MVMNKRITIVITFGPGEKMKKNTLIQKYTRKLCNKNNIPKGARKLKLFGKRTDKECSINRPTVEQFNINIRK